MPASLIEPKNPLQDLDLNPILLSLWAQTMLLQEYRVGQKVSCCIAGCNFVYYAPI